MFSPICGGETQPRLNLPPSQLVFPQLFERGAEDYVDRGRRGVAGRARSGVQAPGHSLQPIVSVIPALNDATSGGTASGSMDPPRETKRASFSKVGLFRSCAPDRPNLEKRRVKAGPTQISKQISRNLGLGQGVVPAGPFLLNGDVDTQTTTRSAHTRTSDRERGSGNPRFRAFATQTPGRHP